MEWEIFHLRFPLWAEQVVERAHSRTADFRVYVLRLRSADGE